MDDDFDVADTVCEELEERVGRDELLDAVRPMLGCLSTLIQSQTATSSLLSTSSEATTFEP